MVGVLYLLTKFLPAYLSIALGFIARRWCHLSQTVVAKILFFFLVPLVVFKSALLSPIGPFLFLVALSFTVSIFMILCAKSIIPSFKGILETGVIQCAYGYFNIGWFGLPLVYVLYGEEGALIMTSFYVGGMLFGNTVGYLLVTHDPENRISICRKLLNIPSLYAMTAGFIAHGMGWQEALKDFQPILDLATLLTSILGMGLVGMSVAYIARGSVAWKKLMWFLASRMVWTVGIVGSLSLILWSSGWISPLALKIFLLFPFLPIAANIIVFTSQKKEENAFIGAALFASTTFSCIMFLIGFTLSRFSLLSFSFL